MKRKHPGLLTVLMVAASLTRAAPALSQQAASSLEDLESIVATRDVDYHPGTNYAEDKDKLDVFMPKGATGAPVIVFFHGGALQRGGKTRGEVLARRLVPAAKRYLDSYDSGAHAEAMRALLQSIP